jgi:hypothetical protein
MRGREIFFRKVLDIFHGGGGYNKKMNSANFRGKNFRKEKTDDWIGKNQELCKNAQMVF